MHPYFPDKKKETLGVLAKNQILGILSEYATSQNTYAVGALKLQLDTIRNLWPNEKIPSFSELFLVKEDGLYFAPTLKPFLQCLTQLS